MKKKTTYSDIDISMTTHPLSKDIVKVKDDNAIKQSIETLLGLEKFSVPFQPEKGSGVSRLLFEIMGPDVVIELKEAIKEVIDKYEPRVDLQDIRVEADYDSGEYRAQIIFQILNNLEYTSLDFILKRTN